MLWISFVSFSQFFLNHPYSLSTYALMLYFFLPLSLGLNSAPDKEFLKYLNGHGTTFFLHQIEKNFIEENTTYIFLEPLGEQRYLNYWGNVSTKQNFYQEIEISKNVLFMKIIRQHKYNTKFKIIYIILFDVPLGYKHVLKTTPLNKLGKIHLVQQQKIITLNLSQVSTLLNMI